jgi:hypothetical protein
MKKNEDQRLRKAILEVINNQIKDNDPPETKQTFVRLQDEGFSEEETLKFIGYVVECISAISASCSAYRHPGYHSPPGISKNPVEGLADYGPHHDSGSRSSSGISSV